jgi:hypothetical protein
MWKQASVQRRRAFMLKTGSAQSSSDSDLQEALVLGSAQAEIGNAYAHAEICMSCCTASALGSRSSDPLSSGWAPLCMRERKAQAFMLKQASSSVHAETGKLKRSC